MTVIAEKSVISVPLDRIHLRAADGSFLEIYLPSAPKAEDAVSVHIRAKGCNDDGGQMRFSDLIDAICEAVKTKLIGGY